MSLLAARHPTQACGIDIACRTSLFRQRFSAAVVLLVVLNGLLPVVSTLAFAATLVFVLVGVLAYKEKPWPAVAGALLGTISLYVGFNLF